MTALVTQIFWMITWRSMLLLHVGGRVSQVSTKSNVKCGWISPNSEIFWLKMETTMHLKAYLSFYRAGTPGSFLNHPTRPLWRKRRNCLCRGGIVQIWGMMKPLLKQDITSLFVIDTAAETVDVGLCAEQLEPDSCLPSGPPQGPLTSGLSCHLAAITADPIS